MAAEHDTSWDVAVLEQTPEGCYIARRPPAEERPVARKLLLGHYMQDAAAHRAAVQNVFGERLETIIEAQQTLRTDHDTLVQSLRADARNTSAQVLSLQTRLLDLSGRVVRYEDVIELYETVARTLQGFNDLIFLKLTLGEKEYLRTQGITYITRLLNPPANLTCSARRLVTHSLRFLSQNEEQLCRALSLQLEHDQLRNIFTLM